MNKTDRTEPQWQDLSLSIHNEMPVYPGDPKTRLHAFATFASGAYQASQLRISCHAGTHMDAPRHFLENGVSVEAVDINRLVTQAWVTHAEPDPAGIVALDKVDMSGYQTGDALIVSTGWEEKADLPQYYQSIPVFSSGSAEWLNRRGVKLFGLDLPTVAELREDAVDAASESFDHPAADGHSESDKHRKTPELSMPADQEGMHKALLSNGVIILESLVNLTSLRGKRVQLIALPLKMTGAEGSPVRACARITS